MRIGHGYDVHVLTEGRKLIIGGVEIPYEKGLLGHSDADVLLHAVSDALLGAAAMGDIGGMFPDDDPKFEGAEIGDANWTDTFKQFEAFDIDGDTNTSAWYDTFFAHIKEIFNRLFAMIANIFAVK